MQHIDNDKLLSVEGWSIDERSRAVKYASISLAISALGSIALIIIPLVYFAKLPSWILGLIIASGGLGLLVSLVTLQWQLQQSSIFKSLRNQSTADTAGNFPHIDLLVAISFALNGLMLCFNTLLFVFALVQFQFDRDYFAATSSELSSPEFLFTFKLGGIAIILLLILVTIAFGYSMFAIYISAIHSEHLRLTVHIFNTFVLLTVLLILVISKQCLQFGKSPLVDSLVNLHNVQVTLCVAFATTILCLLIYATNLRKVKVGYFVVGTVLLCLLFINAAVHFKVFRGAVAVKEKFQDDCGNQLRNTPESFVSSNCYCQKYVKSLDCPATQLAVRWEDDVGKPVEAQLNRQACLNLNCCGTLSYAYAEWFYSLALASLALQVLGFGLVGILYYIAQHPPSVSFKLFLSDLIFGGLITVILVTGIAVYFAKDVTGAVPPQNVLQFEQSEPAPDFCSPLTMLNSLSCDTCNQIRLSLYSEQAEFRQKKLFQDSSKVKQIPADLAGKQIFGGKGAAVSLQGTLSEVVQAYQDVSGVYNYPMFQVFFCPTISTPAPINIVLDFYQIGKAPPTTTQLQMAHQGEWPMTTKTSGTTTTILAATTPTTSTTTTPTTPTPTNSTTTTTSSSTTTPAAANKVIPASIQLGSLSSAVFTNLVLRANDAFTMKSIKDFQGKLFIGDQLYISLRSEDHEYGG